MKTVYAVGLLALIFAGCSSPKERVLTRDEIVKMNVEKYVFKSLGDTASYQFGELTLKDSITFQDMIDWRRRQNIDTVYEKSLLKYNKDHTKFDKMKRNLIRIDSTERASGNKLKEVISYTYYYKFRAKNAFNAIVLSEYLIQTDVTPEYKITNLADKPSNLVRNPTGYDGLKNLE